MSIKVGTFNLNNLFSRYNFKGEIDAVKAGDTAASITATYEFSDPNGYVIRTFKGRLVKGKDPKDTQTVADRITAMDVDVLGLQEVEDIDTLRRFNHDFLGGLYPHVVLVEGNDPRLIDVGLLSKLPIGAIVSWKEAVDPANPGRTIFSRDLLQVEIRSASGKSRLFWIFVNHLKSHYVTPPDTDQDANDLRQRQAGAAAQIVAAQMRPDSRYVVVGDMNDPPDSAFLAPLVADAALGLVNALQKPEEVPAAAAGSAFPTDPAWTDRYKPANQPAIYRLFDQVWLSPALANRKSASFIGRRKHLTGDGSDHDPAWVELDV